MTEVRCIVWPQKGVAGREREALLETPLLSFTSISSVAQTLDWNISSVSLHTVHLRIFPQLGRYTVSCIATGTCAKCEKVQWS
jgi:hypothetical protein